MGSRENPSLIGRIFTAVNLVMVMLLLSCLHYLHIKPGHSAFLRSQGSNWYVAIVKPYMSTMLPLTAWRLADRLLTTVLFTR